MEHEIQELLKKDAIKQTSHSQNQFMNNIFLEEKKNGPYRPVINLKQLNQFLLYHHFKMKGLIQVTDVLTEKDFLVKLDLVDTYFSSPLHKEQQEMCFPSGKGSFSSSYAFVLGWVQHHNFLQNF